MFGTPNKTVQFCSHVAMATFTTDSTTTNGTGFDAKDALWIEIIGFVGAVGAGNTRFRLEQSEDNSSFSTVTNATTGTLTTPSQCRRVVIRNWAGVGQRYVRAVRVNSGFTGEAGCILAICVAKPQNVSDEASVITNIV